MNPFYTASHPLSTSKSHPSKLAFEERNFWYQKRIGYRFLCFLLFTITAACLVPYGVKAADTWSNNTEFFKIDPFNAAEGTFHVHVRYHDAIGGGHADGWLENVYLSYTTDGTKYTDLYYFNNNDDRSNNDPKKTDDVQKLGAPINFLVSDNATNPDIVIKDYNTSGDSLYHEYWLDINDTR